MARSAPAGEAESYWRITPWLAPGYSLIPKPPESDLSYQCNIRVPMDDHNSWFFRVRWHTRRPLNESELADFKYGGIFFPELIPGTFRPVDNKDNDYNISREAQRTTSVTGIKSIPQQGPNRHREHGRHCEPHRRAPRHR